MSGNENNNKFLFMGLNTLDIQYLLDNFPARNLKHRANGIQVYAGGPATNAAITCAYFGNQVDLLSPFGDNIISEFIRNDITSFGIKIIDMIKEQKGDPIFSSILTDTSNGERTVIYFTPDMKKMSVMLEEHELKGYNAAMFDGFYPELAIEIASLCRKSGIVTIMDGGSWKEKTEELLKYIDIAVCSNDFIVQGTNSPEAIFDSLHAFGVKMVAITRGAESILYSVRNPLFNGEIPINKIEVKDTLGAGDIFHGAFCNYYLKSRDFAFSLREAAKVAGESCRYFGTRKWMQKDR